MAPNKLNFAMLWVSCTDYISIFIFGFSFKGCVVPEGGVKDVYLEGCVVHGRGEVFFSLDPSSPPPPSGIALSLQNIWLLQVWTFPGTRQLAF